MQRRKAMSPPRLKRYPPCVNRPYARMLIFVESSVYIHISGVGILFPPRCCTVCCLKVGGRHHCAVTRGLQMTATDTVVAEERGAVAALSVVLPPIVRGRGCRPGSAFGCTCDFLFLSKARLFISSFRSILLFFVFVFAFSVLRNSERRSEEGSVIWSAVKDKHSFCRSVRKLYVLFVLLVAHPPPRLEAN